MKKIIALFVVVSLLACPAFAQDSKEKKGERKGPRGPFMEQMEKDGFIKIEDIKDEKMAGFLKKMDADNDGKVTKEEGAAFREKMRAERAAAAKGEKKARPEGKKGEGKKKAEAKKDGQCPAAKKAEGKKKEARPEGKKGEGKKKGPRPEGRRPEGPRPGAGPREWKGDIVISELKDAPAWRIEMLKKADADSDGKVTEAERKAAREAFRAQREKKAE